MTAPLGPQPVPTGAGPRLTPCGWGSLRRTSGRRPAIAALGCGRVMESNIGLVVLSQRMATFGDRG